MRNTRPNVSLSISQRLVPRRLALRAVLTALVACSGTASVQADSIAYSQSLALLTGTPGDTEYITSSPAAGTQADSVVESFFPGYFGFASGYTSVSPRQVGDSLGSPLLIFRNAETVQLNHNNVDTIYQDYSKAVSTSVWVDQLYFNALSPSAAAISSWGFVVSLSGSIQNVTATLLPDTHGGYSQVGFFANFGGSSDAGFFHELYDTGVVTFDEVTPIVKSAQDPFDPAGLQLNATFTTTAIVGYDFGFNVLSGVGKSLTNVRGEFRGLVAFDADGNVLPDAPNWAQVSSESGADYQILSEIPTPAPEPSSVAIFGTGSLLVLIHNRRRAKRHEPQRRGINK